MKTAGIIFMVMGVLSTFFNLMAIANGQAGTFMGLGFILFGAYLVSRANKKKKEREEKKTWEKNLE